jgi:hypothetical protein
MSKQPSDSFLPSGAIPSPHPFELPSTLQQIQGRRPEHTPPTGVTSPSSEHYLRPFRSITNQKRPLSPPQSRSTSAEGTPAALVEDWRAYTGKLRSQIAGERAHMLADRARMEEVIAEERALWDSERALLKARIAELEAELEKVSSGAPFFSPPLSQRDHAGGPLQQAPLTLMSPTGSNHTGSSGGASSSSSKPPVPQESGRNADGSPFYAPAPQNPARTFEDPDVLSLRVDAIFEARESPIRVTSKELTSSDFGVSPPPSSSDTNHPLPNPVPEPPVESFDISCIQPELEGVSIRASALSPEFTAKILSPHDDSKLSPNLNPGDRNEKENHYLQPQERSLSPSGRLKPDIERLIHQPETRRLTMHAGHTPNHSISRFADLLEESGGATPTQETVVHNPAHQASDAGGHDNEEESGDVELSGPLGLTNEPAKDDAFIAQLVEKLGEVKKSEEFSPVSESLSRVSSAEEILEDSKADVEDDGPALRLKPSLNFGRPIGQI